MNTIAVTPVSPPHRDDTLLPRVLTEVATAGRAAGHAAGCWWARHVLRGPQACLAAALTLSGIDAGDVDVLEALPRLGSCGLSSTLPREVGLPGACALARWAELSAEAKDRAVAVYLDSHDTAVRDTVTRHCLALLQTAEPATPAAVAA